MRARVILWYGNNGDLNNDFCFRTFFNFSNLIRAIEVAASFRSASHLLVRGLRLTIGCRVFIVFLRRNMYLRRLISNVRAFTFSNVINRRNVLLFGTLFIYRLYFIFRNERLHYSVKRCRRDKILCVTAGRICTLIHRVRTIRFLFSGRMRQIDRLIRTLIILLRMSFFNLRRANLSTLFTRRLSRYLILKRTLIATMRDRRTFFLIFLVI